MRRERSTFATWLAWRTEEGLTVPQQALCRVVCPSCDGRGHYVNPAIDGNGISVEEWCDWTDDDREAYLSGRYDIVCEECNGRNVVERLRDDAPDELRQSYQDWVREEREYRAVVAAERWMGA